MKSIKNLYEILTSGNTLTNPEVIFLRDRLEILRNPLLDLGPIFRLSAMEIVRTHELLIRMAEARGINKVKEELEPTEIPQSIFDNDIKM